MKIIILSIVPYKEKDAIIDALSEDGDITFLAKGIMDPKNKNAALNNVLSIADIELNEGNYKYPVLKSSSIISNPMKLQNDYYYLASLLFIAEATKTLLQDEEKQAIFPDLVAAVTTLKGSNDVWPILLAYTAKIFKMSGYEFSVNQCVFCGTKQRIVTFSFPDGGFVCENCFEEGMARDLTNPQMLLIRSAFNSEDFSKIQFKCSEEDARVILNKFLEFIVESYGISLKSAALLKK